MHTIDVNYVLVVHPLVPANSVAELIAYAKANPGKLAYGSAGSGSLPHLATELFKASTGTDLVHVPYKGGGPMVTDLLGGTVQVVIGDQANLLPHVRSGKLRALAVASPRRSANYPDLPTIAEAGVPGFQAVAWNGLVHGALIGRSTRRAVQTMVRRRCSGSPVRQRSSTNGVSANARAVIASRRFGRESGHEDAHTGGEPAVLRPRGPAPARFD